MTLGFQTSYCKLICLPLPPPTPPPRKAPTLSCLTQGKGPPRAESGKRGKERSRSGLSGAAWNLRGEPFGTNKGGGGSRGELGNAAWLRYLVSRFADIRPIPSDTPFEKTRAAVAGVDPVVFPGAAVTTHFTGDI